jgi:DNA-binding transcriptional regulator GbsR (MarR family)
MDDQPDGESGGGSPSADESESDGRTDGQSETGAAAADPVADTGANGGGPATDDQPTDDQPTDDQPTSEDIEAAREEVIDAMARSFEVYGAKRSYGRLYGILYFAEEPLSLDRLVAESGYAKSTVSTAMSTLERFHLVQRRSLAGEGKKAYFEAEDDFWYVFQQFLEQQVRREIRIMTRALDAAEMVLEDADDDRTARDLEKIQELQDVYAEGDRLIDVLTSERLDRLVSVVERFRG